MQKQTFSYYEWRDIKKEICLEMGIKNEEFGNYKGKSFRYGAVDLWSIYTLFFDRYSSHDGLSFFHNVDPEKVTSDRNYDNEQLEDIKPFFDAVIKVFNKFEIEKIYINYDH